MPLVIFPGGRLPLQIFETRYVDMVKCCMRDGTGFGVDNKIFQYLDLKVPYVLGGGAAKYQHFIESFENKKVSGISTGNLFNFIGDGLKNLRADLVKSNINLRKL